MSVRTHQLRTIWNRSVLTEGACRDDGPAECVYTRFKWVRDPDPVQDFVALYEEVEVNPHAYDCFYAAHQSAACNPAATGYGRADRAAECAGRKLPSAERWLRR
jgi:hypothetical protein